MRDEGEVRATRPPAQVEPASFLATLEASRSTPAVVERASKTRVLNEAVHRIIVVGLVASMALLVGGLLVALVTGQALPTASLPPGEALAQAARLEPAGLLSLGLLVLMVTPIMVVVGSVIVFAKERDWRYVLVTFAVLMVMLLSAIVGAS